MNADIIAIKPHLNQSNLHSWQFDAGSETAFVTISGIGYPDADVPSYEFARCATNRGTRSAVFLSDPHRSWLASDRLIEAMAQAIEAFKASVGAKRIIALGHSLGGFTALVLPAFTQIDRVIALAPQLSVDPSIVPSETRWQRYLAKITDHRIKLASDFMVPDTHYTIVHGQHPREAVQRNLVPQAPNICHYVMPKTNHNVPQRLKQIGKLIPFVNAIASGQDQTAQQIMQTHFQVEPTPKKTHQKPTLSPLLEGN
ncbi:alpha/beta fold hydrolase [Algirhabdus cladophorae]|uniref:alpha/beta fold hydrolase n=1 Tax=Algirhabdus cladophorae TaxID=3377108 RepID=UPI003B847403